MSRPFQQTPFFQQPPQVNFPQQGQIYRFQQQTGMRCTNCGLTNNNIETCFRIQRQALDTNVYFYCKMPGHRSNVCAHTPNIIGQRKLPKIIEKTKGSIVIGQWNIG